MSTKVLIRFADKGPDHSWVKEFDRVPCVGEYVRNDTTDDRNMREVSMVTWLLASATTHSVEITLKRVGK